MIGVFAVLVGGFLVHLSRTVTDNVRHDDLLPTAAATITGPDGSAVVLPSPNRAPRAGNAINLLMVGSDSRSSTDQGRSDVIVLVHISSDRSRVDLVHFPRDLYVEIPGHGRNKINAAYAFGGVPLLVETLQQLVNVPIDHVALIDFEGFKRMTDAVGGVDVEVKEASPGFPKGVVHVDGERGLAFVRERYTLSQGDISRGQRQQAFIKAIMLKGLSTETLLNPAKLSAFVDAATANLTVDRGLDVAAMRSLALDLRGLRSGDIASVTAPWSGIGTTAQGASIVVMSQSQMRVLGEALRNDAMASYTDPVSPQTGFSR